VAQIPTKIKEDVDNVCSLSKIFCELDDRYPSIPWKIQRINNALSGLFNMAKFDVGDIVSLKQDYVVDREKAPGWYCYRNTFVKDNPAKVVEVDFRYNEETKALWFVYLLKFKKVVGTFYGGKIEEECGWSKEKNATHFLFSEEYLQPVDISEKLDAPCHQS